MKIFGQHDLKTIEQFHDVASRAVDAALMADGHVGYVMPIGGVAAYREQLSVVGIGFDIACGNAAIRTNLTMERVAGVSAAEAAHDPRAVLESEPVRLLADEIQRTISFGVGRVNRDDDAPTEHPLFLDDAWTLVPSANGYRDALWEKARGQLGTVGSGNHYVDVFYDDAGRIWVGVHFGSRGLGHTIASAFLAISQGLGWGERAREAEVLLDVRDGAGHDYWHLMELAGKYAYAGREWVARRVVEILGGREEELVHNHHNYAFRESIGGEELVVVRKGATPAYPGQLGFVGGSMGDDAVIVRGAAVDPDESPELAETQRAALYSTVHGAGRVMSRTEAAGKKKGWGRKARVVKPGKVSPEMMQQWVTRKGVVLRGGGLDESPHAYRRLPDVLGAQGDTVEVLHTLHPLIVVMAGENEFDPYKD
ncbi:MAG: RtcB family protein [Gemmatimonadaceae bacterium]